MPDEKLVGRICAAPPSSAFYSSYSIVPDERRVVLSREIDLAWTNVQDVLRSSKWRSRYTTGEWPVLYAAADLETAKTEKGYWVKESIYSKSVVPAKFDCIEYEVKIEGVKLSYLSRLPPELMFVHPTNYDFCNGIGREAIAGGADFIEVPSARKYGGVNYPVFKLTAVVEIMDARRTFYRLENSNLAYNSAAGSSLVTIEDVYAMYLT